MQEKRKSRTSAPKQDNFPRIFLQYRPVLCSVSGDSFEFLEFGFVLIDNLICSSVIEWSSAIRCARSSAG